MNEVYKEHLDKLIETYLPQFVSGNEIPVTRTTVTRADLYEILYKNGGMAYNTGFDWAMRLIQHIIESGGVQTTEGVVEFIKAVAKE